MGKINFTRLMQSGKLQQHIVTNIIQFSQDTKYVLGTINYETIRQVKGTHALLRKQIQSHNTGSQVYYFKIITYQNCNSNLYIQCTTQNILINILKQNLNQIKLKVLYLYITNISRKLLYNHAYNIKRNKIKIKINQQMIIFI